LACEGRALSVASVCVCVCVCVCERERERAHVECALKFEENISNICYIVN